MKTVLLLATYNGADFLPELLASLEAQTDPDFTVLMQDDGSSDKTPQLLRVQADKDPRFVFASEQGKHLGPAGNFLSLIRQSSSADALLLCDQDDIWEPDKIAVLRAALGTAVSDYGADTPLLVHSDCSLIAVDGTPLAPSFFRHQGWDPKATSLAPLLVQNNVTGCTLIMNQPLARLVADHGRAKDLHMHDWFIALSAASFGRILFVDRPLTKYRQHGDNAVGASRKKLTDRALDALQKKDKARSRIRLTYTHTQVFRRMYDGLLPVDADRVTREYLATRKMNKLSRVRTVRKLGCVMQSPITRAGQILFG